MVNSTACRFICTMYWNEYIIHKSADNNNINNNKKKKNKKEKKKENKKEEKEEERRRRRRRMRNIYTRAIVILITVPNIRDFLSFHP